MPDACYGSGVVELKAGLPSPARPWERREEVLFKRLAVVVVAAMMVLSMFAASAPAAFAQGRSETAPNCAKGNEIAYAQSGG